MVLQEYPLIICPSCGRRLPEYEFRNHLCKLCATAGAGLLERTIENRPPNEDRLRGIPPHPLTGSRL